MLVSSSPDRGDNRLPSDLPQIRVSLRSVQAPAPRAIWQPIYGPLMHARDPETSVTWTDEVGPPKPFSEADFELKKAEFSRALEPLDKNARARVVTQLSRQLDDEMAKKKVLEEKRAALLDIADWLESKPVLEKNDCSRLHKLKEALAAGRAVDGSKDDVVPAGTVIEKLEHTFVVKHDWAGAFTKAEGLCDEFELPFDVCTFEFRISGRTVIVMVAGNAAERVATPFIEADGIWYAPPYKTARTSTLTVFAWEQIRAICIALDAEVATHSVVRASHKLNEKRERAGKPKVVDFHIVDLARRHRVANPSGATGGGGRKRLHFRRGHWRHYETSKTWIKWCLVGDPDLGFIQKHYTL